MSHPLLRGFAIILVALAGPYSLHDAFGAGTEAMSPDAFPEPRFHNPTHILVVFTKFHNEAPDLSLAPSWTEQIFGDAVGSVNDYFAEVSFGKVTVTGEVYPKVVELPYVASAYVKNSQKYSRDVIYDLDRQPDFSFADYDNDGPDGIPGSGDDDGFVDFLVLMPISRPYDFIMKNATALSSLNLSGPYYTNDYDSAGNQIVLDLQSGAISTANSLHWAVGSICHEFTHHLGAKDLYDALYIDNDEDSAGIGYWGLMGRGVVGWDPTIGPVGLSAYTRLLTGLAGIDNENLIDTYGVHHNIRITDAARPGGMVYRIWVGQYEYFLVEHRRNDGLYYDRQLPANGLLIWHVYEISGSNNDETMKQCDLECADGRYLDAGYPLGQIPDPDHGFDNLDFWSHDDDYNALHAGNLGDATDVFDGITYMTFSATTNPNTNSKVGGSPSHIEIVNIRPDGDGMLFDVNSPPVTDWYLERYPQIGLAMQRFNLPLATDNTSDGQTAWIVYDGAGISTASLVTIEENGVVVEDISGLDEFDLQRLLESRLFSSVGPPNGTVIVRKNLTPALFRDDLLSAGVPAETLASLPVGRAQKLTAEREMVPGPTVIALEQNYPNPFNSSTAIAYKLPEAGNVRLEVYNILGQKVRSIDQGFRPAGINTVVFDAGGLPSGVYLYRVIGRIASATRSFVLIR